MTFSRVHSQTPGGSGAPDEPLPSAYWDSLLNDPRARTRFETSGRSGGRFETGAENLRPLSADRRELLRVECLKCFRIIEIQRLDAIRLSGADATWKDVGKVLLERSCEHRSGNRDDDGCWPSF